MKILVTGGAGFIGSNFIHYWLEEHPRDRIVNFDALTYAGNLENLKDLSSNPNYQFVQGDICSHKDVSSTLAGIEVIVHFAAETHVDRSIIGPEIFTQTNVLGTQVLLQEALKQNIRFHHVSTDEVFGSLELDDDQKFNERTLYDPSSPYSASKAASDHLVRAYYKTYDLPITISNTSNNFGPYMFPEKFIPLSITNILEGKKIPIYGDGKQIRDWLYVRDHCSAIDLILSKGEIGQTYLIGGNTQDLTNLDVARKILDLMGKDETSIEFIKDRPGHDQRYAIDWSKAARELGYQPEFDFEKNLKMTIDWYKNNESWWRRVKSGEYQYYQTQYGGL